MASKGKERENYFRINVLVVDHIKNALVNMLKYYLCQKNKSFEEFINEHMQDIKYLKKSKILYKEEVDKLVVGDNAISGITVDDLEVTLVRRLLDNLCPDLFMDGCKVLHDFLKKNQHDIYHLFKFNERCCQCSQNYKFPVTSQLLEEDQYKKMFKLSPCTNCAGTSGTVCSVSSCIETRQYIKFNYKIKKEVVGHFSPIFKAMLKFTDIRNKAYGHADATVIPNGIYDVYKQDIEVNIMVLAKICGNENKTQLALDDVQKRSCDETLCIQYQNRLIELVQREKKLEKRIEELTKKWETTETNLTKDIADNRQKIDHINDRHIPLHIRKGHIKLIKQWRLEDRPFYDETRGFTAALKMVQSENYMTIIGGPGSGKTATARHIALQLEEQEWEVVPVCNVEDIIQYGDIDHKQVFVRDDVLGIHSMDMNIYNQIINYKEAIFNAIGETSKLLFTCRKSVYKEALKLGLFITKNIVDLQSEDNQLTETEKMAIFQYHCKSKGVNPDLYTSLSFTKANHMFPLLCKLFSMEEQYQRLGEKFFNKPFEYFIKELDKLQRTNTIQYAVLVLCLVNKGKLSLELLPHKHMQEEVFDYCGVNLGTPVKEIKDAIYHMSDTYFTKLDTEYTFTHDIIFEAIAYHYGHENKHQILKHLSSSYIANKVTVYEQASNEDLCIQISKDMYLPLAERLYTDIQSRNLFQVFMNKSLKHGPFLDVFERMLKTKPFDEFESLILRNSHHFVQKTFSSNDHIQNATERMRLYLLFDFEFSEKSDLKHSVRVISWIINYGHTHLLKEIVNHVECNNHSISLIFGSNVIENTRLLLLGCYSNTLDMVELILKYIDPKCIDMECGASSSLDHNVHRLYTPLMVACLTGNLHIVTALLRNNAEVNKCYHLKDESVEARRHKHMDLARYILSDIADTNLRSKITRSPLLIASEEGHCEIVKYLVAQKADVNLTDSNKRSPLYSAVEMGHYDIVEFLLQNGADVNIHDHLGSLPLYAASSSGHCAIFKLLIAHGALGAVNANSQSKTISKRTNGNEILEDSNALHNPYPEEKVNRSKEEQEKEKEGETTFTREQEEKEEIIYTRETKEENEEAIARRKEQIEKVVLGNTRKEEDKQVNHLGAYTITLDALLPDYGYMSPLSFAVENGHIDIVKYILENITDFDLSKMGKPPLFLAAEKGYHDIIDLLLHSEYNDITQTYLDTTPLEIAVWRNNTKVVQLLIQEENKLQKYQGNYHLFKILVDLKRSIFCIDEDTDKVCCHVKDRKHHLPHSLWCIITVGDNDYLTHLLQIGLDINKRNYKGDTLLYRILKKMGVNDKFKSLMEHFEDVNAGETTGKWISLLIDKRKYIRETHDCFMCMFPRISDLHNVRHENDILSEFRRHIRRHSI